MLIMLIMKLIFVNMSHLDLVYYAVVVDVNACHVIVHFFNDSKQI